MGCALERISEVSSTGAKPIGVWERLFEEFLRSRAIAGPTDPAHDLAHVRRVVVNAKALAAREGARLEVVVPAAWLHDCVIAPKDSVARPRASAFATAVAREFLGSIDYPAELVPQVQHAIEAHSFSAGVPPRTLEARVIQDADRLDALGAIGLARCLMLGATMERALYDGLRVAPRRGSGPSSCATSSSSSSGISLPQPVPRSPPGLRPVLDHGGHVHEEHHHLKTRTRLLIAVGTDRP
jgi:hypothetical protein